MNRLWSLMGLPYLPDERDMTAQYNTPLSPLEEMMFQAWAQKSGRMGDLYDYDLRGAWKSGAAQSGGHLPDTFKKPSHPTFSKESKYSLGPSVVGGEWGDNSFTPGPMNQRFHGGTLADYFAQYEPGVKLNKPKP